MKFADVDMLCNAICGKGLLQMAVDVIGDIAMKLTACSCRGGAVGLAYVKQAENPGDRQQGLVRFPVKPYPLKKGVDLRGQLCTGAEADLLVEIHTGQIGESIFLEDQLVALVSASVCGQCVVQQSTVKEENVTGGEMVGVITQQNRPITVDNVNDLHLVDVGVLLGSQIVLAYGMVKKLIKHFQNLSFLSV